MRVRMMKTMSGSRDGARVEQFMVGEEYDLRGTPGAVDLAKVFLREGWAEEVGHITLAVVSREQAERALSELNALSAAHAPPAIEPVVPDPATTPPRTVAPKKKRA